MENLIAGIFGLLLGVVGFYTGVKQLKNRELFSRWQTTKGRVIERGIYEPRTAVALPAFRHAPLIKYRYSVAGEEFTNNSILPIRIQLPQHNTRKWAERQAASFPEEVVVYYNPEDAAESYLKLTSRWTLYLVLASSCLLIAVGGAFLLMFAAK